MPACCQYCHCCSTACTLGAWRSLVHDPFPCRRPCHVALAAQQGDRCQQESIGSFNSPERQQQWPPDQLLSAVGEVTLCPLSRVSRVAVLLYCCTAEDRLLHARVCTAQSGRAAADATLVLLQAFPFTGTVLACCNVDNAFPVGAATPQCPDCSHPSTALTSQCPDCPPLSVLQAAQPVCLLQAVMPDPVVISLSLSLL